MANVSSFSGAMPVIPGGLVELGYVERTTAQSITATTFAGASEVFATDLTFVADGGPVLVEFYCPQVSVGGGYIVINLSNGGSTDMGQISYNGTSTAVNTQYRYTPAAGSQTLNVRAWVQSGTGTVSSGAGGSGQYPPTFLRVSKIVNQNDGLKPFWTPPVVTQLPSQATVGDQVIYAADATNGVYWHLQYDGLGTYPWKFIGGAPLYASAGGTYSSPATGSTSTYVNSGLSGSPSITIPLPGDYYSSVTANAKTSNSSPAPGVFISYNGSAPGSWDGADSLAGGGAATSYVLSAQKAGTLTAASQTVSLVWLNANIGGTASFYNIRVSTTPIRVKAA